ncbi:MAG: DUF4013 domain-containing protein [Anaerolineae bacterium]|nr:DUF4013 domain-containing protein [Anaerolineae bacterium]
MDTGRVLAGITDDKDWLAKLAIAALITALSVITTPILIGLAGWAVLFGYMTQTVRRVRQNEPTPLPAWGDMVELAKLGGPALLAYLVYLLPNLLVGGCSLLLLLTTSDTSFTSTGVMIGLLCCLLPLLLLYNILIAPLFALGIGRYSAEPVTGVFFDFSRLWGEMSANWGLTITFLLFLLAYSLVMGLVGAIPCVGTIISLGLGIPVYGLITGQYAQAALGPIAPPKKPKSRPA